jgi:hypothetical protein
VEKFYTPIKRLNQAIQPEVVGPLFYLKGIDLQAGAIFWIASGTSIDYVLDMLCRGRIQPVGCVSVVQQDHTVCD